MKRFYRISMISAPMTLIANLPLTTEWEKSTLEPGQVQCRVRYGDRQFWLIASRKGAAELDQLSTREFSQLLKELLLKKKVVLRFAPQAIAPAQQTAAPAAQAPAAAPAQQAAPAPAAEEWTCSCGATNQGKFCRSCGTAKPVPKFWHCGCGCKNAEGDAFCGNCGQQKPTPKPTTEEQIAALTAFLQQQQQAIAALQKQSGKGGGKP